MLSPRDMVPALPPRPDPEDLDVEMTFSVGASSYQVPVKVGADLFVTEPRDLQHSQQELRAEWQGLEKGVVVAGAMVGGDTDGAEARSDDSMSGSEAGSTASSTNSVWSGRTDVTTATELSRLNRRMRGRWAVFEKKGSLGELSISLESSDA